MPGTGEGLGATQGGDEAICLKSHGQGENRPQEDSSRSLHLLWQVQTPALPRMVTTHSSYGRRLEPTPAYCLLLQ